MSLAITRIVSALADLGAVSMLGLAVAIGTDRLQQRLFCQHMDGTVAVGLAAVAFALLLVVHRQAPLLRGSHPSPGPSSASAGLERAEGAGDDASPITPPMVSVIDLLPRGLRLLETHLPAVYVMNMLVSLPVLAFQLGAPALQRGRLSPLPGGALVGGLVVAVLTHIGQVVGTAGTLRIVIGGSNGRRVGLREALQFLAPGLGPVLSGAVLYVLVVTLGFMLGGIPGLVFLVWFVFLPQVMVTEGLAGARALHRSRDLTRGYRVRIFGLLLTFFAMTIVVAALMTGLAVALPGVERIPTGQPAALGPLYRDVLNFPNYAIVTTLHHLLTVLVQSYQAVCLTLLYFTLRDRRRSPGS
jgi:hypothetical protein